MGELVDLFSGGSSARYPSIMVPTDDVEALADVLNVASPAVQTGTVSEIEAAVRDGGLGILRVTDVSQRVHALDLQGISLFGTDRVTSLQDMPLRAVVSSTQEWQPEALWTLVAAGDVMMDRGVAKIVNIDGAGGDYLFDGGTAEVTGIRCCSYFGYEYPTTRRTGDRGAVRDLFQSADISMANLESAVLVNAPYHRSGFTFTADASLLDAIDRAGFDYMSLANNHVRNAGSRGIRTAAEQLDERGIAHAGSGLEADAETPGYVDTPTGIRVAILSCDAIVPSWTATADKVGTMNCKKSDVAGRIREIRDTADLVIVFPHWGREYKAPPVPYQRTLARAWVDAGADLVVGSHSHIAGAMGDYDDHVVFFSMGNLIFDQDFRQATMQGVIPEMTFDGTKLVQIQLHPTLIIDAQPNFVAPKDGGQFVLDQMRNGSEGLLPY